MNPSIGAGISYPLYTAGENKRKQALAKIEFQNAEQKLMMITDEVTSVFETAFESYENNKKLLAIEQENNKIARENLNLSIKRLKLGEANSLEVHQAEEYLVQSNTKLVNIQYYMKIAELRLLQLISQL
ncbi:MAG: TolC family protein [Saprospiraceae bacterium]